MLPTRTDFAFFYFFCLANIEHPSEDALERELEQITKEIVEVKRAKAHSFHATGLVGGAATDATAHVNIIRLALGSLTTSSFFIFVCLPGQGDLRKVSPS